MPIWLPLVKTDHGKRRIEIVAPESVNLIAVAKVPRRAAHAVARLPPLGGD
jgi:hypothetical protein